MTHAIVTERLTKYYGAHCVVNCLDLRVPAGTVYGFLGRNGAGKSTTIKMLLGMVQPSYGRVELMGSALAELPPAVRGRIAYLAEGHPLYGWMTVAEAARFGRAFHVDRWNQQLLEQILEHFEIPLKAKLRRLSNGQRANVALALAIAPDPDLLILDDPTLGLDTVARRDFLLSMIHLVARRGRTILFSSHILADVERVADRIGILVDGVLRVDCPTEHFKESVSKVVLEFAGRPPAFPGCAGLVQAWEVGHRLELVIVNFGPSQRAVIEGSRPGLGRRGAQPRRCVRRLHARAAAIAARFWRGTAGTSTDHERSRSRLIMATRAFSLSRRIAWAATLAVGFGTVWLALFLWLGNSLSEAWQGGQRNWPPRETLEFTLDGTPLIQSIRYDNLTKTSYRDLSGRAQEVPERDELLPAVTTTGARRPFGFFDSPLRWDEKLHAYLDEREPTVNWYFVHDGKLDGAGYFVGYERIGNRRIGFIGQSGFHSQPVPPGEWIPVRGEQTRESSYWSSLPLWINAGQRWPRPEPWDLPPHLVYVPSGNKLRQVDLAAHTVTTVFEVAEPIVDVGIPMLSSWSPGPRGKEQPILVRSRGHIHALDHKHKIIKVFAIPTEADRNSAASWYEVGNGESFVVFARPGSAADGDNVSRELVYRIAGDGAIKDQFVVSLNSGGPPSPSKTLQAFVASIAVPAPVLLFVVDLMMAIDEARGRSDVIAALLRSSGPSLGVVLALSSALAVMAWRRGRAFGFPKPDQVAWAIFVLLFGLPAYAGFLLHRRWPSRLPCPNCNTQSAREYATCTECGTRFPNPALKGIEIFA